MESCASCGSELEALQAFCVECGATAKDRVVSLDSLLDSQTPFVAPVEEDAAEYFTEFDHPEWEPATVELPAHGPGAASEPDPNGSDDVWDGDLPHGVPLRLVPFMGIAEGPATSGERPEDFWWPEHTPAVPDHASSADVSDPIWSPSSDADQTRADGPPETSSPPPVDPFSFPEPDDAASTPSAPADLDAGPWVQPSFGEFSSPPPGRPAFPSGESSDPYEPPPVVWSSSLAPPVPPPLPTAGPFAATGSGPAPGPTSTPPRGTPSADAIWGPSAPSAQQEKPRRRVPATAVVLLALGAVAGAGTVGLLTVPVASADNCAPPVTRMGAQEASSSQAQPPSPVAETVPSPPTDADLAAQLAEADAALAKADAKVAAREKALASARSALTAASAVVTKAGVDKTALAAAEAEVTRTASALTSARAAQSAAAEQVQNVADAGEWELGMLRAAEKERDKYAGLDPTDTYWDDEVDKARVAYEQAQEPKRQADAALVEANRAVVAAQTANDRAKAASAQITAAGKTAVASAKAQQTAATKKVARAEKRLSKAQAARARAKESRDAAVAAQEQAAAEEQARIARERAAEQQAQAAAAATCAEDRRARTTAAGIVGVSSLGLLGAGGVTAVRHRRNVLT
ncbi:hypothetical protein [Nocardioides yefusunii]|uniref:Zinc ribbon domain-containing protein n=1 Tax=Nocardioides yefusunii TaxID=2500546 RepID=A0ABW1R0U6_9ACTN|nr:hypothetical protein [Nocardioides yefusunii]